MRLPLFQKIHGSGDTWNPERENITLYVAVLRRLRSVVGTMTMELCSLVFI